MFGPVFLDGLDFQTITNNYETRKLSIDSPRGPMEIKVFKEILLESPLYSENSKTFFNIMALFAKSQCFIVVFNAPLMLIQPMMI